METSPYSLNLNKSDDYYKDVGYLADEVLREFEKVNTSLIPSLMLYYSGIDSNIQNFEEYIFEFLMIGTLWRVYILRALNLEEKYRILLRDLSVLRDEKESNKDAIDFCRGFLITKYLLAVKKPLKEHPEYKIENLDKLLKYLQATGDFKQEIKRLNFWKEFFSSMTVDEVSEHLKGACDFSRFFELRSKEILGRYSLNLEQFLDEMIEKHLWSEDLIFCTKREVEYHLSMFGAEIMNRTMRNDFLSRPRKALILPVCMRSKEHCKATNTNLGLKCMKCSKLCNVYGLKVMGDEEGFEVYMVTHESSAFSKSTQKDRDELGIVGVACVSNLIAGGWKSESLGMPAQCVLLNQATCKQHWHDEGLPTNINASELEKIMGITRISNLESNTNHCTESSH